MKLMGVTALVVIIFVMGYLMGQTKFESAAGLVVVYVENTGWMVSGKGGAGECVTNYEGRTDEKFISGNFWCIK